MRAAVILLTVIVLTAFSSDTFTDSYTGFAYYEGTQDLIYTEEFTDKFIDGKHIETLTKYFDPAHKLIAERTLDFRKSRYAPDFKTEDLRSGYMEGAEKTSGGIRLFRRKDHRAEVEEEIIDVPQPVVIDGGFNQFIKANWSKLEKGESVVFHFTIPARLDYFTLKASWYESNEAEVRIRVEPEKTLLRWLASPIMVRYNRETRRIISYEGKSNISDEKGNNFMTRLVYPKKGP